MSFQPPPPPGGPPPPQGPPSWGTPPSGGLGSGPPPQATAPPGSGKARKQRLFSPWAILTALVLIGVAVAVVVVSTGGDSNLDGKGAAEGFAAVADGAEYDADGFSDLRRCPFGSQGELTDDIADVIDASDDLLDADTAQYLIEETDDFPESLLCTQLIADPTGVRGTTGVSYYAGDLPRGDYEKFLEDDSFSDATVRVEDTADLKGGTLYPYCTEPDSAGVAPTCGADWVDDDNDVVVGLYLLGDRVNADDAVVALQVLLPKMVEALADQA